MDVTPTRADTYLNAEGQAGYDFTNGWLRTQPRDDGTTPNAPNSVPSHGWLPGKAAAARRRVFHVACGDSALLAWEEMLSLEACARECAQARQTRSKACAHAWSSPCRQLKACSRRACPPISRFKLRLLQNTVFWA